MGASNPRTIASGTSDVTISLGASDSYIYIGAHDADLEVFTYNGGSVVDSLDIEEGLGKQWFIGGMDSVVIDRTTTTRVTVLRGGHQPPITTRINNSAVNDVTEEIVSANDTLTAPLDADTTAAGVIMPDTLDLGPVDIGGYSRIYVKFLADTFNDSTKVIFATSENGGWDAGNTAYFDRDTDTQLIDIWELGDGGTADDYELDIGTYGVCLPVATESGCFIAGSNLLIKIINFDLGQDGEGDVENLFTGVIKVK